LPRNAMGKVLKHELAGAVSIKRRKPPGEDPLPR
jgi:hypothetical protein